MTRSYYRQLELLAPAYDWARQADVAALSNVVDRMRGNPALFVGSGGNLAVARLAADLHERCTGMLARALTPLELAGLPSRMDAGVMIFSAGARNPDAQVAVAAASSGSYRPAALVTLRQPSDLPDRIRSSPIQIVTVTPPAERDGFLATTSVLALATILVRCYFPGGGLLPPTLTAFAKPPRARLKTRCLILTDPAHSCVGIDLETRLHETGLSAAQFTDYRNVAHGRHVGLARHLKSTTVVAFASRESERLASITLKQLPSDLAVVRIETATSWPVSALDLLVGSMYLFGSAAKAKGLDPARPTVPTFGRRLYHLSVPGEPIRRGGPVDRKLAAAGIAGDTTNLRQAYEQALDEWLRAMSKTTFGGVVLDYDGTCCTTEGRFESPDKDVRAELVRLLADGVLVGFASGRGGSLHVELRKWVPSTFWDRVELGLYNGAVRVTLNDELSDQQTLEQPLAEAARRLRSSPLARMLTLRERHSQLRVEVAGQAPLPLKAVGLIISESLQRPPALPLKALTSSHSIDVIPAESSKVVVIDALRARCNQGILAIGDQGQLGGNDFELLAAIPQSLSVDRCSADATRCWNLDTTGSIGPRVLVSYLRMLRIQGDGVHMVLT